MEMLSAYDWPGNIRELKNVVERAILVSSRNVIEPSDICPDISATAIGRSDAPGPGGGDLVSLQDLERQQIIKVLNSLDWHRGEAARVLGISPKTLYRKIKEFQILPPIDFTADDD
jgi:DNA-binding NtrC family response regulator